MRFVFKYTNRAKIPLKKYDIEYVKCGDYLFDKGYIYLNRFKLSSLYFMSTTNDLDIYWYYDESEKDQPIIGINCSEKMLIINPEKASIRNIFESNSLFTLTKCELIIKFTDSGWVKLTSKNTKDFLT